jgi:hypothetical protein
MTEEEWLRCYGHYPSPNAQEDRGQVVPMLNLLRKCGGGKRKLYLFGCACCRRVWDLLEDRGQAAVEAAEQHADGQIESASAEEAADRASIVPHLGWPDVSQRWAARAAASILTGGAAQFAALARADPYAERKAQYLLVCDLFLRPGPLRWLSPTCLAWNDGMVVRLADGIYQDRAFEQMPILGDALEESGCVEESVLSHCRGPGPHARGCWVIDLITAQK